MIRFKKTTNETGSYTMELTLGQAAKQVGCGKATISRALKSGDLSGQHMPDGSYKINPAELMRWNGERSQRNTRDQIGTPASTPAETIPLMVEVAELRVKLAAAELRERETRETLSETVEDLRRRLDASETERRDDKKAFLLLTAPPPVAPDAAEVEVSPGEFQRYTGNETFTPKPPPNPPRSEIATEGDRKPAERGSWFSRLLGRQTA